MNHLPVRLMLLSVVTLAAASAYADNCGPKDRVPLPACAYKGEAAVDRKPGLFVQNNCSYPITVKFDVPILSDIRKDVPAGGRVEQGNVPRGSTEVFCCPRYNSCGNAVASTPPPPPPPAPAGPQNLALGKPATQSSTHADAARAVDGNTDGNWVKGSVAQTTNNAQAWWQVDLGAVQSIKQVVLYNRTDCCAERLSNFDIKVSPDGSTWTVAATVTGTAQPKNVYPMNVTGRFVRVQLRGSGLLTLAEVQVFGQ